MPRMLPTLRTERVVLRTLRDEDAGPLSALNADPQVMEHFPALLSREESDAFLAKLRVGQPERGLGTWAMEVPGVAPFVGVFMCKQPGVDLPAQPCVEVGWRMAVPYWGQGYVTEAGHAVLRYAFDTLHLGEIVSFTATTNHRSMRVMERLGLHHDPAASFDYPTIPVGHRLRAHVLYRLGREEWQDSRARTASPA
jgi:RimJ/RimL family protein N-acetyltransferase